MSTRSIYEDGRYLEKNPLWHVEESRWKAREILHLMERNSLAPKAICEVGCGAGEVLKQLQENMPADCMFCGYEVSASCVRAERTREYASS